MKYIALIAVILAGAFFYPQIAESVGGPCQALEAKIVGEIREANPNAGIVAGLLSNVINGEIGRTIAEDQYPQLPTSLGCAVGYYDYNPREFEV